MTALLALTGLFLTGPGLTGPPAYADVVPGVKPAVNRIGDARLQPATDTILVPITYRCTDRLGPAGITHYLTVRLTQPGADQYQVGERNNLGGLAPATCNGHRRTDFVRLYRDANAVPPGPAVLPGRAEVQVDLSQHTTNDSGGWYVRLPNDAQLSREIRVR